jgi:CubicO group peptidase (beta-lactamase class C family)
MRYADYVRTHVFEPAGMETIRVDEVETIIPNRAQGYRQLPSGELRNSALADTSYRIPGGGLCGTVLDLARFAVAFQAGNQQRVTNLLFVRPRRRVVVAMMSNLENAHLTVVLARQVSSLALKQR